MYKAILIKFLTVTLVVLCLIGGISTQINQASFAANVQPLTTSADPVRYDTIVINRGGALNQDVWRLYIPAAGLYLTAMTAGHPGSGHETEYRLVERGQLKASMYRSGASNAGTDTMGMNIISWYEGGQDLNMASLGSRLESTTNGLHTSWGTFALSGQMATSVGFGVARLTSYSPGRVSFPTVWANVGDGWDPNTNEFVASQMGIYFFSFSTGLRSGDHLNLNLRINGQHAFDIYRSYSSPLSYDTVGRDVLTYLYPGDRVELQTANSGYSDYRYMTNFNGLLYNTMRPERAAWAVYRDSGISGTYDPLPFTVMTVNEGGVWHDDRAYCPFTGIYYVHISVGVQAHSQVTVTLMKESLTLGELRRESTMHPGIDTLSRSVIVECRSEESIRVVTSNTNLYSDAEHQIGFLGFYLFQ